MGEYVLADVEELRVRTLLTLKLGRWLRRSGTKLQVWGIALQKRGRSNIDADIARAVENDFGNDPALLLGRDDLPW